MAVVCAFDFSPFSLEALSAAAALARAGGTELRAVHVNDVLGAEIDVAARDERLDRLRSEMRHVGADADGARVLAGSTVDAILRQCEPPDARLIVVGARGTGRSSLLGSVAAAIATSSPLPVLVVRQRAPLSDAAHGKNLRIDVAFGKDASSEAALAWANAFALAVPAVVRPLRATALGEVVPNGIGVLTDDGSLGEQLASMAARDAAGLIVVGRTERLGLARLRRPTLRRVLGRATTNVVCVPASYVAGTPVL